MALKHRIPVRIRHYWRLLATAADSTLHGRGFDIPGGNSTVSLIEAESHPDFRARYETLAPGLADYLPAVMRAYAESASA